MKPILNLILFFLLFSLSTNAQLPNGSTAPNWTLTDINGETHTLYDYLDEGKTVFIDFFATWCGPCWSYHNSGNMEDLYDMYGPDGTDEIMVFAIEGDASTTLADLYGTGSNTTGDWVTGTPYPMIEGESITGAYQIGYWPTIYGICANKKITEVGQVSTTALYNFAQACPQPGVYIDDIAIRNVSCAGGNTGEITLFVSGWPENFSYNWSNGMNTATASNLAAGSYRCTVTNEAGDSNITELITVTGAATPLEVEVLNTTIPDCLGGLGSINVNASGGGSNYEYEWQNGMSGSSISGLVEGFYTVSVTDDLGCITILQNIEVEGADYPDAIVQPVSGLSCDTPSSTLDGSASTQGNSISYFWSTDVGHILSGEDESIAEADVPGSYFFTVYNAANGCLGYNEIQLQGNNVPPEANITVVGVSGMGATDGSAICHPTGGVEPYYYEWSTGATTDEITDLAPGIYMVSLTDANNCGRIEEVIVEGFGCELDAEILTVNVNCAGAEDGFVIVNVLAGNGPFNFLWSNGETLDNIVVGPGEYSVTITDGDGCELILTTTVTEPNALTLEVTGTEETGAGANDGTATAIGGEGTMPYTYAWSNDSTSAVIEGLAPGTYTVTIMDANECTATESITLNAFDCQMNAEMLVVPANCFGAEDGFAILEIIEGTSPFTFLWSNGETLNNIAAGAGEYSLSVTDANNCVFVYDATILEPTALLLATSATSETAVGANDGTATATISGGVAPYTYTWSEGSVTATITNLAAGEYCVTVTDINACTVTECVTVNAFECNLDANMLVVSTSCFGADDGFAIVEIIEGTPPFTFLWSNGETLDNIVAAAGEYIVSITDNDNCEFILTATVTQPDEISPNVTTTAETDDDANDGTATANPSGGTPPYTYLWSNDSTSISIDNLVPGTYTVTVTDANECVATEGVTVSSFSCDLLIQGLITDISCAGECDAVISVDVSGGTPPYSYAWTNDTTGETIEDLCEGEYIIVVTDVAGCEATLTFTITEPTLLELNVATATILSCPASTDGVATVVATGGTEPYTYVWSNGVEGATADGLSVDTYTVTATDANNCVAITEVNIFSNDLEVPVVITQDITVFLDEGGFITVPAIDVNNESTDNCEISGYILEPNTFNCEHIGENEVTLTVVDLSGNQASLMATVTVMDTIPPTIICPEDILIADCGIHAVFYDTPTVLDNCTVGAPVLLEGLASGEVFPVGVTVVTYGFEEATCSFNVIVTVPDLPVISVETQPISCTGANDGAISVTVTGESGPYTYLWNTGDTTPMISDLAPGSYSLTVTDNGDCASAVEVQLLAPDPIIDAIIVTEVINEMDGQANGAIDVAINSLLVNPTFEWFLDDMLIATTEDLENLSAGEYTLVVTDENGCQYSSEVIVVDNVVGVSAPTLNAGFTLSPNPTSGLIFIKIDHDFATVAEVQVWDVLGQRLLIQKEIKAGAREVQLDLSAFASGTYLVQLNTEVGTFIRKVVR